MTERALTITKLTRQDAGYYTARVTAGGVTIEVDNRFGSWQHVDGEIRKDVLAWVAAALRAKVKPVERHEGSTEPQLPERTDDDMAAKRATGKGRTASKSKATTKATTGRKAAAPKRTPAQTAAEKDAARKGRTSLKDAAAALTNGDAEAKATMAAEQAERAEAAKAETPKGPKGGAKPTSDQDAEALRLRVEEQLTFKQIASRMGWSAGPVAWAACSRASGGGAPPALDNGVKRTPKPPTPESLVDGFRKLAEADLGAASTAFNDVSALLDELEKAAA